MMRFTIALIAALVGLDASAQQRTEVQVATAGLSAPANQALNTWLAAAAAETTGLRVASAAATGICDALRSASPLLVVAPLSTYRRCLPAEASLAALELPLVAEPGEDARRVLLGPLGSGVAGGLRRNGLALIAFAEGETRVLGSNREIATASDLRGRRVLTDRPSEAARTMVEAAGGTSVSVASEAVHAAVTAGHSDTTDLALGAYTRDALLSQRSVLVSNHVLDPVVIAIGQAAFSMLGPTDAGALETEGRRLSRLISAAQRESDSSTLARLQASGVRVSRLTPGNAATLRAPLFESQVAQTASRFTFATAATRAAATKQAAGKNQAPYWTVYFVTNREFREGEFTAGRAATLAYGQAEVEITYDEPGSYGDEIKGLMRFLQGGRGITLGNHSSTPFPRELFDARAFIPARAPIVYVHGFNNSFDEALKRAAWLGWNARRSVILFSWPSQALPTPDAYRLDAASSAASAGALADFLRVLGRAYGNKSDIDLLCHSMGNKLLLDALQLLAADPEGRAIRFRQLISVAADVPNARIEAEMERLTALFSLAPTLYVSDHDLALGISKRHMNPQEGNRAGLAPPVLVKGPLESVFVGPNDFSFIGHAYFDHDGVIADDMMEALRYGTRAGQRRGHLRTPQGYFELKRIK